MINKVITITSENPMYKDFVNEIKATSDDDLIIVARSYKNRKSDEVTPIKVKNGIYFYVALQMGKDKLGFIPKATPSQIYKAKENMVHRARLGVMMEIMFSSGKTLEEFENQGEPMIVVTLDNKSNGAGILYCEEYLKALREKIGDFYILPSAIHEILIVPTHFASKKEMDEMVRSVNKTEVTDDEFLGNNAFYLGDWI